MLFCNTCMWRGLLLSASVFFCLLPSVSACFSLLFSVRFIHLRSAPVPVIFHPSLKYDSHSFLLFRCSSAVSFTVVSYGLIIYPFSVNINQNISQILAFIFGVFAPNWINLTVFNWFVSSPYDITAKCHAIRIHPRMISIPDIHPCHLPQNEFGPLGLLARGILRGIW